METPMQPNAAGSTSPLNLIIIGPPGSGKGSQCQYLATRYGIVHISSGDLLRREKTSGTLVGQFLIGHWTVQKVAGITFELLEREVKRTVASGKGFVIDGSPRTASEAKRIIRFLANEGIGISAVIEFAVKEEQAVHRVNTRLVHPPSGRVYNLETCPPKVPNKDDITGEPLVARDDDGDTAMHSRFRSWEKYGPELTEFLKSDASGKPPYFEIDANKSLAEVNASLSELVERLRTQPLTKFDAFKGEDNDPKHKTNPVLGGTMASAIDRACVQQQIHNMTQSKKSATHFPGTHPVSMTKSTLHQLVEEDHRVARKIDGQRRLLLIMNERCFLVDRKMFAETFPTSIDSKFNLTLFDGEIVKTKSKEDPSAPAEWHYVVFDVIAVSNNFCGKLPLYDRLAAGKTVLEALKDLPFKLEFQEYLPLDQLPVALGKGEATSPKYELDGLIFIPIHSPYRLGFCQQLLKWKTEKDNTIDCCLQDLKVGDKTYWQLHVGQEGDIAFYDWIDLAEEDIAAHSLADGDIIECYWDRNFVPKLPPQEVLADYDVFAWSEARAPATGGWRVHRKRTDKDKPNADWVVVKIEQSIVESLTEKDLLSFVALKADVIEKLKTEEHGGRRGGGRYREKEGWDRRGQGQGSRQYGSHDNNKNYHGDRRQYGDRDNRQGRQDRHDNRQDGSRSYGNRYNNNYHGGNGHHHGENGRESGGGGGGHGNRYERYQSKASYAHGGDSHNVAGSPPSSASSDDGRWRRGDQSAISERSNYEKARREARDQHEGSSQRTGETRTTGGAAPRGNHRQDNHSSEGPRPTTHQPTQPIRGSYAQALGGASSSSAASSSEPVRIQSQAPKAAAAAASSPQPQSQPVPAQQQAAPKQAPAPAASEGGWAAVARRGLPASTAAQPQQQSPPQQGKGNQGKAQQQQQQQQGGGKRQGQGQGGRAASRS